MNGLLKGIDHPQAVDIGEDPLLESKRMVAQMKHHAEETTTKIQGSLFYTQLCQRYLFRIMSCETDEEAWDRIKELQANKYLT